MQNRYVGDIGDFGKYGLLRALYHGRQLGVAWYLCPDETHNEDGGSVDYLCKPDEWRSVDPELFDGMKEIVDSGHRCVGSVEESGLLPSTAIFAGEMLRFCTRSNPKREKWRREWFERVECRLSTCDVVFADPDNGLYPDDKFRYARREHLKRLPLCEALRLCDGGRPAVFYHHNNRDGRHPEQIRRWKNQLPGRVHAFYGRNRAFFVANADQRMVDALKEFAEAWRAYGKLDPDCT